jgi:restriction endonuclease S subunit
MVVKYVNLKSFSLDPKLGLKDYSAIYPIAGIKLKQVLKNKSVDQDIKSGRTPSKFNEDYWGGENEFLTMQDIDTSVFCLKTYVSDHITEYAIENEKTLYEAPANSLVVSNAMTIGLAFIIDRPIYINQNVFHLDIDQNLYNITFLKWYFNLKLKIAFQKTFASKYYSKDEYGRLLIPNIPINKQNIAVKLIEKIEKNIKALIKSKKEDFFIINQVFGEELNFDWIEFENLKSQKQFNANLADFSSNVDCRFSYKFYNKAGQFLYNFLCSKTNKRIKNFISEPIVLGKSVSPSDYDEEGEFYYIAMSNIKTWAFEPEDCKKVLESYSLANLNKTVKKDDILLARSGEGTIGKVALIEDEDIQAIFADFTQRIRLKNYNTRLAYYYFKSDLFQYLVYTHKKGLGNNTNIFPSQIQEFPIPDWTEEKQAEIVEKIKSQIDAQSNIDKEIEKNTAKINLIIEESIKNK